MKKPHPHNPDNLTKKQIGRKPWRLLDEDEINHRNFAYPEIQKWLTEGWDSSFWSGCSPTFTYRTRLTRAQLRRLK